MAVEPGDTEFVTKLDEKSKKLAKDELNERNEKDRLLAVQTFRQWILEQSWLRSKTDFTFLLRFLRSKKFSQLEARKKLEHYWMIQGKRPEWFRDRDPLDDVTRQLMKMGVSCCPMKTDKQNRRVIIVRLGNVDTDLVEKHGLTAMYKSMITFYDWLMQDENVQVNGLVFISDYTGITMQKFTTLFNADRQKDIMSYFEHGLPARLKSMNVFNEPAFFDLIYSLVSPLLSKKMKNRMHIHGKSLVKIYKKVGYECLPDEYLPDDYEGPRVGSWSDIVAATMEDMKRPEFIAYVKDISSDKYGIDKDRIPTKDAQQEVGSYRKLNTD